MVARILSLYTVKEPLGVTVAKIDIFYSREKLRYEQASDGHR